MSGGGGGFAILGIFGLVLRRLGFRVLQLCNQDSGNLLLLHSTEPTQQTTSESRTREREGRPLGAMAAYAQRTVQCQRHRVLCSFHTIAIPALCVRTPNGNS